MTLGVLELTYLLPGQNSNNIKKVYGVVNELLCRKRSEKKPTGNDDNLVEKFSEFFVSKVENIRHAIEERQYDDPIDLTDETSFSHKMTSFSMMTSEEVVKVILKGVEEKTQQT